MCPCHRLQSLSIVDLRLSFSGFLLVLLWIEPAIEFRALVAGALLVDQGTAGVKDPGELAPGILNQIFTLILDKENNLLGIFVEHISCDQINHFSAFFDLAKLFPGEKPHLPRVEQPAIPVSRAKCILSSQC